MTGHLLLTAAVLLLLSDSRETLKLSDEPTE